MTRAPEPGLALTTTRHRVPFYETDAMGIVHHSNYVRFLELARIDWMAQHHRPYTAYMEEGRNFATTHVSVDYRKMVRFDETVEITIGLEWIRGASLRLAYRLDAPDGLVATAATEHALVDTEGRVRRIPKADRDQMAGLLVPREALGIPAR